MSVKIPKPPYRGKTYGVWVHTSGGQPAPDYGTGLAINEVGLYDSVKTPGWHTMSAFLKKNRNNPFNGYYMKQEYLATSIFRTVQTGPTTFVNESYNGNLAGLVNVVLTGPETDFVYAYDPVHNRAINDVLRKLSDNSVNLAQAFAERKQTIDMLGKTVNRLASAALAIRRGKMREAVFLFERKVPDGRALYKHDIRPSPNNLANHWLEFSYGWRPLVSDIYGSMEQLAKTFSDNKPVRFRGRAKDSETRSNVNVGQIQEIPYIRYKTGWTVNYEASCVIQVKVDSEFARTMSQVGMTNPALLAWELVPYSFVVDWFLPIGSYLSNLTATHGLTFVSGTVTRSSTVNYTGRAESTSSGYGVWQGLATNLKTFRVEKNRVVLADFPSVPLPEWNRDPFGVRRVLSGISLLTQAFTGQVKKARRYGSTQ